MGYTTSISGRQRALTEVLRTTTVAGPPRWTIAAVGFEPSSENGTFDIHCTPRPEPASFSDATLRMRGGGTSGLTARYHLTTMRKTFSVTALHLVTAL